MPTSKHTPKEKETGAPLKLKSPPASKNNIPQVALRPELSAECLARKSEKACQAGKGELEGPRPPGF